LDGMALSRSETDENLTEICGLRGGKGNSCMKKVSSLLILINLGWMPYIFDVREKEIGEFMLLWLFSNFCHNIKFPLRGYQMEFFLDMFLVSLEWDLIYNNITHLYAFKVNELTLSDLKGQSILYNLERKKLAIFVGFN
ncbi:hypothetical protein ACJX0J_025643, partial [Zea mays]